MRFEWDVAKDIANVKKHGISFAEAMAVFEGNYFQATDERHSEREDRFHVIGPIAKGIVTVVHTIRKRDVVRIISAWRATKAEARRYRAYLQRRGET